MTRSCTNPFPQFDGQDCLGDESRACEVEPCTEASSSTSSGMSADQQIAIIAGAVAGFAALAIFFTMMIRRAKAPQTKERPAP